MNTRNKPRNLQEEIGKRDPFVAPELEAYLNIVRTHAVLSRQTAALFKEHGISDAQYNALRIVAAAGKQGVRSETIGRQMVAQDPDTTRLIDRLEKRGLVNRRKGKDDRRCTYVTIAEPGRKLVKRLDRPLAELHRSQLGHMNAGQLKRLSKLLFEARHRPDSPPRPV